VEIAGGKKPSPYKCTGKNVHSGKLVTKQKSKFRPDQRSLVWKHEQMLKGGRWKCRSGKCGSR